MGHGPLVKSISLYYLISIVKDGCGNFGVKCVDNISLSLFNLLSIWRWWVAHINIAFWERGREGEWERDELWWPKQALHFPSMKRHGSWDLFEDSPDGSTESGMHCMLHTSHHRQTKVQSVHIIPRILTITFCYILQYWLQWRRQVCCVKFGVSCRRCSQTRSRRRRTRTRRTTLLILRMGLASLRVQTFGCQRAWAEVSKLVSRKLVRLGSQ